MAISLGAKSETHHSETETSHHIETVMDHGDKGKVLKYIYTKEVT